jgi:hypothetical protein
VHITRLKGMLSGGELDLPQERVEYRCIRFQGPQLDQGEHAAAGMRACIELFSDHGYS